MQTSRINNSRIFRIKNANSSGYCFCMSTNILGDFQICISVPLTIPIRIPSRWRNIVPQQHIIIKTATFISFPLGKELKNRQKQLTTIVKTRPVIKFVSISYQGIPISKEILSQKECSAMRSWMVCKTLENKKEKLTEQNALQKIQNYVWL